ncbi:MAG: hypothetical protein GY787_07590 [Alteromonadales bacterium]|nr:hypothetical protein [Alteromonadales bacterium]
MATPFQYAPPAKMVDGLFAVPIDITNLQAQAQFNVATQVATVTATIEFTVGPDRGCPIFDLRQPITSALLDGIPFPVNQLEHHDFGGGFDADLRIIEQAMDAESEHNLTLTYTLHQPNAQHTKDIEWNSGQRRVNWDFYLSDLYAGRYLEMWFPCNLLFDRFPFELTLQVTNAVVPHTIITNGTVTTDADNEWTITFPAWYSCHSHMLILTPQIEVESLENVIATPDGQPLTVRTFKSTGSGINLANEHTNVQTYLAEFLESSGSYSHDASFTTYFWPDAESRSGMEYAGGTTTKSSALRHEVFHSWWARGISPATHNDSWLDEGWTTFNMINSPDALIPLPFNMVNPPTELATFNPYHRYTSSGSYSNGKLFWRGVAALIGLNNLRTFMREFYQAHRREQFTTGLIEGWLIAKSGVVELADYFERFVHGLNSPAGWQQPDIFIRDAEDDPGNENYNGTFWNSPDLWIRNSDDGAEIHQPPEFGQHNYFHARVTNRGNATARTFIVTFNVKPWLGTEFTYPGDFLPSNTAAVGYNLAPGETKIVKATWRRQDILPKGTHACWISSAYTPKDEAISDHNVWDDNNLAQKNLAIIDALPNTIIELPIVIGIPLLPTIKFSRLELIRPRNHKKMQISLFNEEPELTRGLYYSYRSFKKEFKRQNAQQQPEIKFLHDSQICMKSLTGTTELAVKKASTLKFTAHKQFILSEDYWKRKFLQNDTKLIYFHKEKQLELRFASGASAGLPIALMPKSQYAMKVRIEVPKDTKPGEKLPIELVQRDQFGQVVGGVSIQVQIVKHKGHK